MHVYRYNFTTLGIQPKSLGRMYAHEAVAVALWVKTYEHDMSLEVDYRSCTIRSKRPQHHSHSSSTKVPQNPQSKLKDNGNLLFCPPVKACTLIEPFASSVRIDGNANRPVPTSKVSPPASRLTTSPEIVMPAAPGLTVTPSTTANVGFTSTSNPSILTSDENVD